jgi:hypothetical protein
MKQIIILLRLLPRGTLPEYSLYAELYSFGRYKRVSMIL